MSLADIITAISTFDQHDLAALLAAIAGRMAQVRDQPDGADGLVDTSEAARLLGVSESWLYHAEQLPFAVKVGGRRMYSRTGIQKYIRRNRGKN